MLVYSQIIDVISWIDRSKLRIRLVKDKISLNQVWTGIKWIRARVELKNEQVWTSTRSALNQVGKLSKPRLWDMLSCTYDSVFLRGPMTTNIFTVLCYLLQCLYAFQYNVCSLQWCGGFAGLWPAGSFLTAEVKHTLTSLPSGITASCNILSALQGYFSPQIHLQHILP